MTRLHLLATGTPTPTPERYGSAYALEHAGGVLMVDCGPAATYKLTRAGIRTTDVTHLLFTHHHFDHDADYPCFLLTRWDQAADAAPELMVHGPAPTAKLTNDLIGRDGAYAHDLVARIEHPGSQRVHELRGGTLPRHWPVVHAADIEAGDTVSGDGFEARSAYAPHAQPWLDCVGWRVTTDAGVVCFTGDTEPCEQMTALARDADVLVCMCWDDDDRMLAPDERGGLTGTKGAARMAAEADVGTLVLVHTGARLWEPAAMDKARADVAAIYGGVTVFGRELTTVDVG